MKVFLSQNLKFAKIKSYFIHLSEKVFVDNKENQIARIETRKKNDILRTRQSRYSQ